MSVNETDLSRFCVSVQSNEKERRKKALVDLKNKLFDNDCVITQSEIVEIWETVNKHLAKCLIDDAESCRNLSIELWQKFIEILFVKEKNIIYLLPILTRRLSFQELQEPSEEVRLNYVRLLRRVITIYKEHLPAYSDDLTAILSRTVADTYPEIKCESCECIEEFAISVPAEFYSRSEIFVKPILSNFGHRRYKVRVASVRAIGRVLQYGNSKLMEEVATPLAQRLFDQTGAVRLAVIEVAGRWFVELRDRYSWWSKLIPLLVTGLHDEIEAIRIRAGELWDEAGKLYMLENESDERFKDKMDFLTHHPKHYPHQSEKFKRPNLGCRVIVQRNLGRLLSGIIREIGDWLADIRVRSAQLLCVLVLNAEQDITQHIEKLLPAMYRACNDDDPRVATNVEIAAEYMGYFVVPSIYCPLILPTLEDVITTGHLRVFAAILRGSEPSHLASELPEIGRFLRQSHVCQSKKSSYQNQLLACCHSIIVVCDQSCSVITEDLFIILFTLLSTCNEESTIEIIENLLERLAKIENKNLSELYSSHLRSILAPLKDHCENWTINSDELFIFRACLKRVPRTTAMNADLVLPILEETTSERSDPSLRLKMFILLSEYFEPTYDVDLHVCKIKHFGNSVMRHVVLPGLVWSAGRTAEAIRTAAICCLCSLLEDGKSMEKKHNEDSEKNLNDRTIDEENRNNSISNVIDESSVEDSNDRRRCDLTSNYEDFPELFEKILPVLTTLVDDNARKTRFHALRGICLVMTMGEKLSLVKEDHVNAIYPYVLKRLDDGCDDVRIVAVEALVRVWQALKNNYDVVFGQSHVDYLYTTVIIHFDDPETKFQTIVLDAVLKLASIHPALLAEKITRCKSNFRNKAGLDRVLNRCYELLRKDE